MRKQLYLQEARKARVPIEPSMNEQCAVILVRHVVLGIEKRKFKTAEKISAVYLWWDMERPLWDRRTRKHVSRGRNESALIWEKGIAALFDNP